MLDSLLKFHHADDYQDSSVRPSQKQSLESMRNTTRDGLVRNCIKAVLLVSESDCPDDCSSIAYL